MEEVSEIKGNVAYNRFEKECDGKDQKQKKTNWISFVSGHHTDRDCKSFLGFLSRIAFSPQKAGRRYWPVVPCTGRTLLPTGSGS